MAGRLILLAIFFVAGFIDAAEAHSPIKGIGAFYNGMLHPLLVPAHLLALLAVGLLIGQRAPLSSRSALSIFSLAAAISLTAAVLVGTPIPRPALLSLALVAGLAVALSWPPGMVLPIALAAAAGTLVGLNSKPDGIAASQIWLSLSGTGLGAVLAVTYVGGLAASLHRPWQKIAVRVLGSWTAASAFLVLTLELLPARTPA